MVKLKIIGIKKILLALFLLGLISMLSFSFINFHENKNKEIFLTDEEISWLKENDGKIKIGYTTDYEPVEFLKNDKYVGMSADYFKLLEKKLNVNFDMIQFDNWSELIEEAKNGNLYGITAATKTEERSSYLEFTLPYILNPNVIITRENFSEELNFEKLSDSTMKVIVVEEYAIIDYIDEKYPKIEYETVSTASEGLRKVSFGKADAMIIEVMSAAAEIERDNISNLIVNTETPYESNLSIATSKEIPILNQILNKGLAQITKDEKKTIKLKWLPFENKSFFDNKYFWLVLFTVFASLIIIIIGIIFWNHLLKEAVEDTTKMLKESEKRFEALSKYSTDIISRFDSDLKHLYVNPAVKKITNFHPDEFIGKTYCELGFSENLVETLESAIKTVFKTEIPYKIEFEINDYCFLWSLMPEFSNNEKSNNYNYVSAVITSARDITERKKTEKEIEYKSYHDDLTGLNNRTYFNEKLTEYTKNCNLPLGIILADLNGLKITNDTLGHIEGDRLLKKVSEIFKKCCTDKDLISRIGGDEFLLLLPNKNEKEVRKVCNDIKEMCKKSKKDPIRP
ncbi:MAG: transporter substrate-binding domain-containing protein, partial [Bacillota bacterium]|nr:transporter substrate-binding domain-containing protein [Bacillota bacterium]